MFEQLGYQQENPGLRNSFLAGAYELREGVPAGSSPKSSGPDFIRAMSTELFLDFLAIRMDSRLAEGMRTAANDPARGLAGAGVVRLGGTPITRL